MMVVPARAFILTGSVLRHTAGPGREPSKNLAMRSSTRIVRKQSICRRVVTYIELGLARHVVVVGFIPILTKG
jgi:hypothetical protein